MNILIKGMEMPNNCWECPLMSNLSCSYNNEIISNTQRREECPLVEVPGWTPVTERLPNSATEYVLCCGSKGGMFVGWAAVKTYDGSGKCTGFQNSGKGRSFTHWMPLPEPPKDGET